MYSQVKRAFQDKQLSQLVIYAVTGSVLSVHLSGTHYTVQFTGALLFVLIEFGSINLSAYFNSYEKILSLFILLINSSAFLPGFLASVFVVWLILIPHVFLGKDNLLYLALLGQLTDLVSSIVVLEGGMELNPFASYLIGLFGVLPGLTVLKVLMIGLPIFWSYKVLEGYELRFFLKFVFLLGVSLAVRNFIFI